MYQESENLLKIENLAVFRSDLPLFETIDFQLISGEALQISGTNGSGKTSLLRCLCGLSSRYSGSIYWNGKLISSNTHDIHKQILYLGHALGLKPRLTVNQNLSFYQQLRFDADQPNIHRALKALKIENYLDEQVANLSAGQKRRVALARIISEPVKLWILDEPMVALDTDGQAWLEEVCNQHLSKGGLIILTSHQPLKGIDNLTSLTLQPADLNAFYKRLGEQE
ncbi:MAG: cytochrome c biogenesis heme-transporting ATPase CcmA [Kangiellaceae bacterium]